MVIIKRFVKMYFMLSPISAVYILEPNVWVKFGVTLHLRGHGGALVLRWFPPHSCDNFDIMDFSIFFVSLVDVDVYLLL